MKFLLCSALAFAVAAPVAAQSTGTSSKDHHVAAEKAATPAPATDPAAGTTATPATPPAKASDPATILKTEFPAYDKDSSGSLSKDEFSSWLIALRDAAPQQTPMTETQQTQWLGSAFSEADADKSSTISLAELTSYLTRGAKG